jgi:hypothetical protein
MGRPSFVQLAGTSGGAGKTTLSRALAAAIAERGRTVELVEELPIFELPELLPLGDRFLRKDFPGPDDLLESCAAYLEARPAVEWVIEDGSWVALAEDIPWAQASWVDLVDYARRLRALIDRCGFEPVVLWVDTPADVALVRRRERDGDERVDGWIDTMGKLPALTGRRGEVEVVAGWAERMRRIYVESGWPFSEVPGGAPVDVVLAAALEHLGIR